MAKTTETHNIASKDLILSGSLSLRSASEIRQQILAALDEAETVKLLLQDVEEVDLSFVQIFCSAHRSAVLKGKSLLMQSQLPEVFTNVIEDAGLQGHIGCSADDREGCVWQDHNI